MRAHQAEMQAEQRRNHTAQRGSTAGSEELVLCPLPTCPASPSALGIQQSFHQPPSSILPTFLLSAYVCGELALLGAWSKMAVETDEASASSTDRVVSVK